METKESLLQKLVAKAEEDADFRVRLMTDPNTALTECLGIEIPEDFNLIVHEEDARTSHLVLPASAELTDRQLEQVAGGFCNVLSDWYPHGS